MATNGRNHTSDLNDPLAGANLTENYQNAVLELHNHIKASGAGTVVASSDGTTADLNDNVSTIADVVSDTAGNPHTWIVYQMAAGYFLALDCEDGAATPRVLDVYGADAGGYDLAAPSVNNKPTANTPANEWSRTNVNLIPTSTPATPMTRHADYDDAGEWWFAISIDGTGDCETLMHQPIFDNPDNPTLPYSFYFVSGTIGSAGGAIGQYSQSTNWRTHHVDNTDVASVVCTTPASQMSNYASGVSDGDSQPPKCPLMHHTNISGAARSFGSQVDLRGGPSQMPSNIVEDNDTDTERYVTMQNLWVLVVAAQLNATPNYLDL